MAQTKTIQLLRSSQLYVPSGSGSEAKTALENAKAALTALTGRKDGEIVLARYQEANADIKSVLGIYHTTPNLPGGSAPGWTFIQDVTESQGSAEALQAEIDAIERNVGLGDDGTYTSGYSSDAIVGSPKTLKATVDAIVTYIKSMDLTEVGGTSGDVITAVSQADGKVSASKSSLTDVKMTGYEKTSDNGAITATDTLEVAVSKLENGIAAATVKSTDKTVKITDNSGKDLSVNIDNTTLVKNETSGVISSALKIIKETSDLATNVKEQYKLVYGNSTSAIGEPINIYKDSALLSVNLLHATSSLKPTYTNGKWTDIDSASQTEANLALCFAYQLADGTTSVEAVAVGNFLRESEFKDGLVVNGTGEVRVLVDPASEQVVTAYGTTNTTAPVLSVSSDGVKVSNIQNAIDAAVAHASADLAVTAQGDDYITAAVDANNNKKINVTADVQPLTATEGTAGTYDANGAQTAAPTHGTLSGVANSLGDAADIATKVKTYVDGEIAIEAARSDAKNLADLKTVVEGLDGTATASSATNLDTTPTADFKVLTKVAEVDGKVVETTVANGSTAVTLKKLAATGAAADVSIADSGSLIKETTVEGALQEIATNVRNNALVSNDVIVVTPDTTDNNTKLSVTTGNGLEKTGNSSDTLSVKAGDGIEVTSSGVAVKAGAGLEIASDAVAIKIDSASAMATSSVGMLTVSSSGLKLSDTWDCGTF